MNNTPENARHAPKLTINIDAIASRIEALDSADLCPRCARAVTPVTADAVQLLIEVIWLYDALTGARRESADRLAAIRAALGAARDGESDPLAYLRWCS